MPLQPGTRLGRYEILSALGAGGMGEVYRAHDDKLGRDVALKLLLSATASPGGAERLLREARAASAINHPHICTIYEVGEHGGSPFIAMEYLDGETLLERTARGALPADAVVELAVQIADALDAAHAKGIVHRDLKPANLFVTARGAAKVLDFGVATILSRDDAATVAPDPLRTSPGDTVGTVAYMSPEQARGEVTDARSDLFAFGVVLYEMAAGRRAFASATAALTYDAILNRQPPPLSADGRVPAGLAAIVTRLLAKEPGARYQSARDVLADLRELQQGRGRNDVAPPATSPSATPSIAVLPFTNLSTDLENDYLADGITEEVIGTLGRLPGLRVAGRTSSFSFRGRMPDLSEVGEKLRVATVLTGSVRRAGPRLRISVELVNVVDGFQMWSERFDRQADDIFAVQDEIANAIADKLRVSLTGTTLPSLMRRTTAPGAYELYLEGRVLLNRRGPQMLRALECFQRAVALDPGYALAHAGAADAYTLITFYGAIPQWEAMPKAQDAARRAIAIDPTLADPHAALACVLYCRDWNREASAAEIATALRLNPRLVTALTWQSLFLAAGEGRFDEAAAAAVSAAEGDPLAAYPVTILANTRWLARRPEEAAAGFARALELEPGLWQAARNLGLIQVYQGRHAEGIATLERALTLSGRHPWVLITMADAQALAGRADEARRLHDEVVSRAATHYVQSIFLGCWYSTIGDLDGAFAAFARAEREREAMPLLNHMWFMGTAARRDPRFAAMMRRAGVTPAPDLAA